MGCCIWLATHFTMTSDHRVVFPSLKTFGRKDDNIYDTPRLYKVQIAASSGIHPCLLTFLLPVAASLPRTEPTGWDTIWPIMFADP